MKKLFLSAFLFFIILVPNLGFAAPKPVPPTPCPNDGVKIGVSGLFPHLGCSTGDIFTKLVTYLLAFISMFAVVVIILGGYQYVMSQGNTEAAGKARKSISYAVIGLVVAVMAYTIISVVNNTVSTAGTPADAGATNSSGENTTGSVADAAAKKIARTVSVLGDIDTKNFLGADGQPKVAHFNVSSKGSMQDIYQLCATPGSQGTADVTVTIPLKATSGSGTTKSFSGQGTFDTTGTEYDINITFDNSGDPFDPSHMPDNSKKAQTTINMTFDGGCNAPSIIISSPMSNLEKGSI
jgi:hypothetical protein